MVIDRGAWRGRVTVENRGVKGYLHGVYIVVYMRKNGGRFFAGYYMADFIGVNGGFFEECLKKYLTTFFIWHIIRACLNKQARTLEHDRQEHAI